MELLKSPGDYHGQEIEITGTIHERVGDSAIYLTKNGSKGKAVWIEYSRIFMEINKFEELDGGMVKVRGEFDKDDKGSLGEYAGTLKETKIISW